MPFDRRMTEAEFLAGIDPDRPVLIAGPTGAGKSDLALKVAEATGGKRVAHLSVVILMIAILALLGLGAPELLIRVLAGFLIATTTWLALAERKRYAPVSAIQFLFAVLVVAGVPFSFA